MTFYFKYIITSVKGRENMIYLISLAVIILDQLTKNIILHEMTIPKVISVTPFFNLVLAYNTGVSFSMFNTHNPYVLSALALAVCALLAWWMTRETDVWTRVGLALIVGGAIGNVIDRFLYGAVVDFLDFYIGSSHWPAFNVADSAICMGAVLVALRAFLSKKEKKHV